MCLEYALRSARRREDATGQDAVTTLFRAMSAAETNATTILFRRDRGSGRSTPPAPTPADAAAVLDSIALDEPAADLLRDALAASVDAAMYWQEPDGADRLCGAAEMAAPLRRVATIIAAAAEAAWWSTAVAVEDQWSVPWDGGGRVPADAGAELRTWREQTLAENARAAAERPDDPGARWSGTWWSIPPNSLVHTTRSLGEDGPAGLWFVEDSFGGDEAVATPVDAYPARVIEIGAPEDWASLCRRHPLDVTSSRRQDWYRVTGRDGPWAIPDWAAVSSEADGVHLTVRGYLSTATRAVELGDGRASMIAGWNPDTTYWFRGVSARPAHERRWARDEHVWRSAAR